MNNMRKLLCWSFGILSLPQLLLAFVEILNVTKFRYLFWGLHGLFVAAVFSFAEGSICAIAWWTLWKGRPSARGWAIAASFMQILLYIRSLLLSSPPNWTRYWCALGVGIVGLVVFSQRYEQDDSMQSESA
jgi:hypothetical protein